MKIIYFILLLLLSHLSIMAQGDSLTIVVNTETGLYQPNKAVSSFNYEEVVQSALPKSTLWVNLKKWVSSTFNTYRYVVDLEDKEAGVMIVKWSTGQYHPFTRYIAVTYHATFQIDVREKKYRIKVYDAFANIEPDNLDNLHYATRSAIKIVEGHLLEAKEIGEKLNNSEEKWPLDNHFISIMEAETNYELKRDMSSVQNEYNNCCKSLLSSLKSAMGIVDDF